MPLPRPTVAVAVTVFSLMNHAVLPLWSHRPTCMLSIRTEKLHLSLSVAPLVSKQGCLA